MQRLRIIRSLRYCYPIKMHEVEPEENHGNAIRSFVLSQQTQSFRSHFQNTKMAKKGKVSKFWKVTSWGWSENMQKKNHSKVFFCICFLSCNSDFWNHTAIIPFVNLAHDSLINSFSYGTSYCPYKWSVPQLLQLWLRFYKMLGKLHLLERTISHNNFAFFKSSRIQNERLYISGSLELIAQMSTKLKLVQENMRLLFEIVLSGWCRDFTLLFCNTSKYHQMA